MFVVGEDIDTNFIERHHDVLFARQRPDDHVFAQAALFIFQRAAGCWRHQSFGSSNDGDDGDGAGRIGFGTLPNKQEMVLIDVSSSDATSPNTDSECASVTIHQVSFNTFDVRIKDGSEYMHVRSHFDPRTKMLQTFYPGLARLDSTVVEVNRELGSSSSTTTTTITAMDEPSRIHLFQQGRHHILALTPSVSLRKVISFHQTPSPSTISTTTTTNHGGNEGDEMIGKEMMKRKRKILSPMPCKILRIEVIEGDIVQRNQILVVVESMKMETVIRCPIDRDGGGGGGDGGGGIADVVVVGRVHHREGVGRSFFLPFTNSFDCLNFFSSPFSFSFSCRQSMLITSC